MPPPQGYPHSTTPPQASSTHEPAAQPEEGGQADVVTALDARLQELQATVAALVDKSIDPDTVTTPPAREPEPEPPATAATGDVDPDVMESSKILQLAKRTADAVLSEARDEAAGIVSAARRRADEEFTAQRDALAADQKAWESRRRELVKLFEELDGVLGNHRMHADRAHEVIRQALSGQISEPIVSTAGPSAAEAGPTVLAETAGSARAPEPRESPAPYEPNFEVLRNREDRESAADAFAPPPPTFEAPTEDEGGVVFGTPPPTTAEPVTPEPPAADETQPAATPFYPWAEEKQSPVVEQDPENHTPNPPPHVQRRGLFGH